MKKSICIFISRNSKPDLYINIIGYLISKFREENIASIYLLNIFDFPLDREKEINRVRNIKNNIAKQIEALSKGTYFGWSFDTESFLTDTPEKIEVSDYFKKIYNRIISTINEIHIQEIVILEDEIESALKEIVQKNEGDYIFDITGLMNRYLVEVIMFLHENDYSITAFEMQKTLSRNHKDLLHNLSKTDIKYSELNPTNYQILRLGYKHLSIQPDTQNNLKGKVETWIEKLYSAKTDQVVGEIITYSKDIENIELLREVIKISSRWKNLKSTNHEGTLSQEDFNLEANKINVALTELVMSLYVK